MKRAGILTINDNNNYGNRLQNYAVQTILKNQYNLDVKTIINNTAINKKEKMTLRIFLKKSYRKLKYLINKNLNAKRKKFFIEFNDNINFWNKEIDINFIPDEIDDEFDIFFTGSDQVWNPTFLRTSKIDFLTFTDNEKRNSISASIGIKEIPIEKKEEYSKYLSEMNHISVREEDAKNLIKKLTNRKDIEVLIDPTMMLTAEDWNKVIKKPNQKIEKKYILNYFLGRISKKRKKEIERIAKENDCEIINILDTKSKFYQTGPSEFLYLEKNAFLICTDSFHSAIFAIIFNRPVIIFNREDDLVNMNSRLETLISKFKLEDRCYKGEITKEHLNVNYENAYKILKHEKEKFNNFIKICLI